MNTLSNVKLVEARQFLRASGLPPDAYPEARSSKTGVSVRYAPAPGKDWYVFRASYGREDRASDVLVDDGTYTYIAKKHVERYVRGKRKRYLQTLIPNLLFAYTTEDKAEEYANNTAELSFLSYYYNHFELDSEKKNPPLKVPADEMGRFIKATSNRNKHLLFVEQSQCRFKSGETVRVVDGPFNGLEGLVARVSGQQRVIVKITQIGYIATAYIPTSFLQAI